MTDLKSAGLGLAAGLAITIAAAPAVQSQSQPHDHKAGAQPSQSAPAQPMQNQNMQGMDHGRMMADPAMRQQMMERMRQCHETMSQMMAHMEHAGQAEHQRPQPQ